MNITRHLMPSTKHYRCIKRVCHELFSKTHFAYFGMNRFYPKEGRWTGVYSDHEPVENALKNSIRPPLIGKNGIILPSGIYLNSDLQRRLDTQVVPDVFNKYYLKTDNTQHREYAESGINFVRHSPFYQELFYFSTDLGAQATRAYYEDFLPVMKNFCAYASYQLREVTAFSESCKERFQPVTVEPEIPLEPSTKTSHLLEKFSKTKYKVPTRYGDVFLSKQEKATLHLLSQGLKGREIADVLEISYRTYETYYSSLKTKLSCNERHEVIQFSKIVL